MRAFSVATVCSVLFNAASQARLFDSITASGLVGSHFGVPGANATFDYVIVGGGTAGLAIATRLAEGSNNTIAVIEAGGFYQFDNSNRSQIPGDAAYYLGTAPLEKNTLIDWQQYTQPQVGLNNRSIFYTRGKTLGGSSARNFMVYQRGTKDAYQLWADQVGDQSYTFDNLLPFFKKSVNFEPPNYELRPKNSTPSYDIRAFDLHSPGPVSVSFPNWANSFSSWAVLAMKELGLKPTEGLVSGDLLGFSYATSTIDRETQTRSSAEASYLRKALLDATRLTVYTRTLAKRVLFDENKKATGVAVNTDGMEYIISANKEVIVSCGAFRSPQLLMVSGIGPKETLEKFGISAIADRPGVGQNMWDHLLFGVTHEVKLATHSALTNLSYIYEQMDLYNNHRQGIFTNPGDDILGWEKLPSSSRETLSAAALAGLAEFPPDWPEIEFLFDDAYSGLNADYLDQAPLDGKMYASVNAAVITPFSRGNVTILSNDTSINPAVSPNYLLDPRDQEIAIAGFKRARDIWNTKAFQSISNGEKFPGNNITTDEEILENIRNAGLEVYHVTATCKMGKKHDKMAVVDSKAKVFGVQGLRVVDGSAFPFLPPGHPQATVYCLAEKIAHSILHEEREENPKDSLLNEAKQLPIEKFGNEKDEL